MIFFAKKTVVWLNRVACSNFVAYSDLYRGAVLLKDLKRIPTGLFQFNNAEHLRNDAEVDLECNPGDTAHTVFM
jgi:hypothetical protein